MVIIDSTPFESDLDNALVWTENGAQCASAEALHADGKPDRRSSCRPDPDIGQLEIRFGDTTYIGSGCLMNHDTDWQAEWGYGDVYYQTNNFKYLLTAAHNFIQVSESTGELVQCDRAQFYLARDGKTSYSSVFQIKSFEVHPSWRRNPRPGSGYDVAVAIFCQPFPASLGKTLQQTSSPLLSAYLNARDITITGYPGEKCGRCFTMSGPVVNVVKTDTNLVLYDIDTTKGNSGSPVLNEDGHVVAVHVGSDNLKGVNFATVLRESKMDLHALPEPWWGESMHMIAGVLTRHDGQPV